MDTATETPVPPPPAPELPPAPEPPPAPQLLRSRSRRMIAGVAGGIANRYDVDVSLVRVAFVVLAFLWGLGVILYAALWAFVPREPAADGEDDTGAGAAEPTSPWLAFALLASMIAFGLLLLSSWWGGPRWGGAFGLLVLALLLGLLVVAIAGPGRGVSVRRLLAIVLACGLSLFVLLVGTFLVLVAWTGVPIAGGVGERVYAPVSMSQLHSAYRLAAGDLTVDLRRVHFSDHAAPRHLTASVAVGVVTIDVPRGVVVDVTAHSGIGNVVTSPAGLGQFQPPTAHRAPAQLVLNVDAGIGQVQLNRVAAG